MLGQASHSSLHFLPGNPQGLDGGIAPDKPQRGTQTSPRQVHRQPHHLIKQGTCQIHPDDSRRTRQVHRHLHACDLKKSWPKASFQKCKRSMRLQYLTHICLGLLLPFGDIVGIPCSPSPFERKITILFKDGKRSIRQVHGHPHACD